MSWNHKSLESQLETCITTLNDLVNSGNFRNPDVSRAKIDHVVGELRVLKSKMAEVKHLIDKEL